MFKKLFIFLIFILSFAFSNDKLIKIAAAAYPMEDIVKIAKVDLEKQGYTVEIFKLTDYVSANIGLKNKDFDANFHQHEPFMQIFNEKNKANLVKVKAIYDYHVGFYSKKYKKISELPNNAKIAIPNDPTNLDRSLRLLASNNLISLKETKGLYKLEDISNNPKNFQILLVGIPSLVQAYQEVDLAFNWPSHMLKIGVSVKDALLLEKETKNKYAIILAAREDNKNSKKIKDLTKTMSSKKVKEFLEKNITKKDSLYFKIKVT